MISCRFCKALYTRPKWLEKHERTCNPRVDSCAIVPLVITKGKQKRRGTQSVHAKRRQEVWEKYVGNKFYTICFCCRKQPIYATGDKYSKNNKKKPVWEAGHILSQKEGGSMDVDNLLPICSPCNGSMKALHWDLYVEKKEYPPRIWGKDLPKIIGDYLARLGNIWNKRKLTQAFSRFKRGKIASYLAETRSSRRKIRKKFQNFKGIFK
jgi:hypothetical protein